MATIDFPSNPTTGQKYTFNGIVYTFTGKTWTASANITDFTSPNLTGTPTAATPPQADSSQRIATTAFVQALIAAIPPPPPQFPAGTLMLFQQSTAPPTWTKDTNHNDKSLRVVNGATSSGGVQAFSTVFGRTSVDNTTLDGNTLPVHAHSVADPTHNHGVGDPGHGHGLGDPGHGHGFSQANDYFLTTTGQNRGLGSFGDVNTYFYDPSSYKYLSGVDGAGTGMWVGGSGTGLYLGAAGTGIGIYNAGGGAAHAHGMDIRVLYVDIIIARKD
jgi:hypothetical protein